MRAVSSELKEVAWPMEKDRKWITTPWRDKMKAAVETECARGLTDPSEKERIEEERVCKSEIKAFLERSHV